MKKWSMFILISCLSLLVACQSQSDGESEGKDDGAMLKEWYVTSIEDESFHGVGKMTKDAERNDYIVFHYPESSKLKVGQKVNIETNGIVMESYPGQMNALDVKVIEEKQDGATHSEEEFIRELQKVASDAEEHWGLVEQNHTFTPIIQNVAYDASEDRWEAEGTYLWRNDKWQAIWVKDEPLEWLRSTGEIDDEAFGKEVHEAFQRATPFTEIMNMIGPDATVVYGNHLYDIWLNKEQRVRIMEKSDEQNMYVLQEDDAKRVRQYLESLEPPK